MLDRMFLGLVDGLPKYDTAEPLGETIRKAEASVLIGRGQGTRRRRRRSSFSRFFGGVFSCLPCGDEDDDVPAATPFPRSEQKRPTGI
ncbi:hypothetical protein X777_13431 [Ooceraea biroi]|uniref:Uncharacterized protein n=1 Tax=Ooceraea biroi TaxID=2015173 RepID=A0A026WWB7_OOCBI|nr:hypothetical protein X777_13431 [Ooceraea biroi]